VDSAFAEYYEAQNKIFAETKATGIRPNYTVFEKILDQRDAKLKMILTPGQYTKFKNEVEENLRPQIKIMMIDFLFFECFRKRRWFT
jgi:hypothetical protein